MRLSIYLIGCFVFSWLPSSFAQEGKHHHREMPEVHLSKKAVSVLELESKQRLKNKSAARVPSASVEVERPLQQPGIQRGNLKNIESFYAKLERFNAGKSEARPRIYWLGDSHTAADFMTHRVRERFFKLFGNGGPGFVRIGSHHYRHAEVKLFRIGDWLREPRQPARRSPVLDGVFGYNGIRFIPKPRAEAGASWGKQAERKAEPRKVVLQVRLDDSSKIEVSFGHQSFELSAPLIESFGKKKLAEANASEGKAKKVKLTSIEQVGPISWVSFALPHFERLSIRILKGRPEIFGAILEYKKRGGVLDTSGINGARIATILAWEKMQHIAQVKRRDPDLVVLSYGTNEVFDGTPISRYPKQYEEVMARLREAVPNISCWIIGPTDAAWSNGESRPRVKSITEMQRKVAADLNCAFSSPAELMGGEGAFRRWMLQRPRLARSDKVHLTTKGYHKLGDLLAAQLLP